MGAEFAGRYPKVASRLQLEPDKCEDPHIERLLEGFAFLAARVHLKIDDDFPGDHRGVPQRRLPALHPAAAGHVAGGVPARSRTGKADDRLSDPARHAHVFAPRGRRALQVQELLRHHALAAHRLRRAMADAGPPVAPGQGPRGLRGLPARVPVPSRDHLREARARFAAPPPERRRQSGLHALRAALQQLPPDHRPRSDAGIEAEAGAAARHRAPPRRLCRGRGDAAVSRTVVPRLPAAAGVLHLPREVPLSRPLRVRRDPGRGVRRAGRVRLPHLALRAERPPPAPRGRRLAEDDPARLHAHRQPVPADLGAGAPRPAPTRISGRGRRPADVSPPRSSRSTRWSA